MSCEGIGSGFRGLSGAQLKWLALICMTVDHIGAILLPGTIWYLPARLVGRLAFPLYCFLLEEGFCHTGNPVRYLLRLACFAGISEIPFNLAFGSGLLDPGKQNVFFTLSLGLAALMAEIPFRGRPGNGRAAGNLALLAAAMAGMAAADFLRTDYGAAGVMLIFLLHVLRSMGEKRFFTVGLVSLLVWFGNPLQMAAAAAFALPAVFYNGRRGNAWPGKNFFYAYYPAHLLALAIVGGRIHG